MPSRKIGLVWRLDGFLFLMGQKIIIFGYNSNLFAGVVELVDTLDLGSSVVRRESSSLSFRTIDFFESESC